MDRETIQAVQEQVLQGTYRNKSHFVELAVKERLRTKQEANHE